MKLYRLAGAVVALASVLGGSGARAQSADLIPKAAYQSSHALITAMDAGGVWTRQMNLVSNFFDAHPAWNALFRKTATEAWIAEHPQLEASMAKRLSIYFNEAELKTLAAALNDPEVRRSLLRGWAGQEGEANVGLVKQSTVFLLQTEAGRSMMNKSRFVMNDVFSQTAEEFFPVLKADMLARLAAETAAPVEGPNLARAIQVASR